MLIAVLLVVAFGPVLWLIPSRKDRRLAALRARARQEGLVVEIRHIPKPDPAPEERVSAGGRVRDPSMECAAYGITLKNRLRFLPAWRLVRRPAAGSADPFENWQYDTRPVGEGRAYLEPLLKIVSATLARLPEDAVAFELSGDRIRVYWLESPGSTADTVARLAGVLGDFEQAVRALEERIAASREGEDS